MLIYKLTSPHKLGGGNLDKYIGGDIVWLRLFSIKQKEYHLL